ncbi:MAG TPA: hypothetical protein ENN51_03980, partial [candidate division WOR-3 bacterium]|nr:hypothetical protein [candidate division WOR-3 bacterium]
MTRIIISLVLLAAGAFGAGFPPDLPAAAFWGRPVSWSGVRDIVPGVVGFEPGASELFLRPARLGFIGRGGFEVGGGSRIMSEQRTRLVYDQFENAIGEIVVADNLSGSWYAGPAAVAYRVAEPVLVAAGIRPVTDYKYDYYKEYRDDFYVVIGTDRVEAEGLLYEASVGTAVRPVSWLALGVSGGYRFGSRRVRVETMRVGDSTALYEEGGRPRGIGFAAGLAVEPLAGLRLDAGFDGGTRLDEWRSAAGEDAALERNQPWQARVGVAWFAAGVLPSRVSAEAGYVGWTGVDSVWSNVLTVRGGVEHSFVNGLRLSYGAGVEP